MADVTPPGEGPEPIGREWRGVPGRLRDGYVSVFVDGPDDHRGGFILARDDFGMPAGTRLRLAADGYLEPVPPAAPAPVPEEYERSILDPPSFARSFLNRSGPSRDRDRADAFVALGAAGLWSSVARATAARAASLATEDIGPGVYGAARAPTPPPGPPRHVRRQGGRGVELD
jgi:hypothetical protein